MSIGLRRQKLKTRKMRTAFYERKFEREIRDHLKTL